MLQNELVERLAAKERECEGWRQMYLDLHARYSEIQFRLQALEALRDL